MAPPLEDDFHEEDIPLGMEVDWLFPVEIGTFEALPVISGESATVPVTRKNSWVFVVKATHRQ